MKLSKPTFLNSTNLRLTLILFVYSVVVLFFLSPDSYLRDLYCRHDSACFFLCGKAWMNGMVPYVDFTDSKGPLLWLIYGVGYLLNHHSYVGVFWISSLFYTATLFFAYKLNRLFVDEKVAAVVVAILPLFLFLYKIHFEVRAEDFCYTFVMLSLYCTCRVLKQGKEIDSRTYLRLGVAMGASCMCCLLIKYNVALMLSTLMAVVLFKSVVNKSILPVIKGMIVGLVLTALPFVVYFMIIGNFGAFIQEYFVNTYLTLMNISRAWHSDSELYSSIPIALNFANIFRKTFVVIGLGTLFFCWRQKVGYLIIVCYAVFLLIVANGSVYYYTPATTFAVFLIMPFIDIFFNRLPKAKRLTPIFCALGAIVSVVVNVWHVNSIFDKPDSDRQNYYRTAYVMSQIEKPKVMIYALDGGVGTPADALPACLYTIMQYGATDEMVEENKKDLMQGKADFIFVWKDEEDKTFIPKIESYGYVFYSETPGGFYGEKSVLLYGRPGLRLPPDDFYVSQWDVWLKRNIFGI